MNHNVLCLVFICCVIQIFSVEIPDQLIDTPTRECLKEFDLDTKILSKYFDEKFRLVTLDEDGIKLIKCLIKKGNYYTPDGEFNKEVIIEEVVKFLDLHVHREVKDKRTVAAQLYDKCGTRNGKDQVEEMQNFNNCIVSEAEKV